MYLKSIAHRPSPLRLLKFLGSRYLAMGRRDLRYLHVGDRLWLMLSYQINGADIRVLDALGWNAPVEVRGSWKSQRPYANRTTAAYSTLRTPALKP